MRTAADGGSPTLVPPGDPDGVREGARALARAAGALGSAARRTTGVGLSGSAGWSGPSSSSFVARTGATSAGLSRLGDAMAAAARALEEFADVLADAQRRGRRAQADLLEAAQRHAVAVRAAAEAGRVSVTGLGQDAAARAVRAAQDAQRSAEERAAAALREARAHAQREAEQAQEAVDAAARRAAWRVEGVVDDLRATTAKDLLGWLGGPDVAFGLLGLFGQGVSAKALYDARKALLAGDVARLASMDPAGYQRVLQAAAQHGDTSLEALRAQLAWESKVLPRLVADMHDAAVPLRGVPAGRVAATLDLLGKLGMATSLASNGYTVFLDDQASGTDKWVAGANTVGLGMAATGSAGAMGLIGLTATTGWVPVVGQVVLAVTAAYMAYDWYRDNRERVHAFFDEVGDRVEAAADWTEQELREYAEQVRRDLATARDVVVGVAHSGAALARDVRERGEQVVDDAERLLDDARERAEDLLDDAGELADDARERAGRAVSAVNPFD